MTLRDDGRWVALEAEAAIILGPGGETVQREEINSPYEYLLRALESHITAERESLSQYRQLKESTNDPVIELVMGLILEDEERHHALMRRIAVRFQDDLNWSHSPEALPVPSGDNDGAQVQELLGRFVASERAGIHELQDFARRSEGLYGGLPTELLEMMALDSEKHEHLLRFLFRRLGASLSRA
ncbi:MAG: hypothetical protein ACKVVP_01145 [Chloroflexota bacterium]